MKTAKVAMVAITLASTMGFAKTLAKMEVICLANEDQNVMRTVYLTTDNSPLIANPLGELLIVDSVTQPNNESVALNASADNGSEMMTIKNTGEGTLALTAAGKTTNFTIKCYGNGQMKGLSL